MSVVTIRAGSSHRDRVAFRQDAAASWARAESENGAAIPTNRTTVTWDEQRAQQAQTPALAVSPDASDHVYKPDTGNGGTAADLTSPARYAPLLRRHGWEFNVKGEPWHAVYNPTIDPHRNEDEDMFTDTDRAHLNATTAALFGTPAVDGDGPIKWRNADGSAQAVNYGVLPLVIHNQKLIAQNVGELSALREAVAQIAASGGATLDVVALEAAAERGAREAIGRLVLRADG